VAGGGGGASEGYQYNFNYGGNGGGSIGQSATSYGLTTAATGGTQNSGGRGEVINYNGKVYYGKNGWLGYGGGRSYDYYAAGGGGGGYYGGFVIVETVYCRY
jgi:hypothetical protein